MREEIRRLKETLCDELANQAGRKLTSQNLDDIYKLIVSVEKIMKMEVLEEQSGEDWYSERGRYSRDGRYGRGDGGEYNRGGSYDNESLYRRGEHYVRGHYSRDDGKHHMIERLERMMNEASGEEREALKKCIMQLEKE